MLTNLLQALEANRFITITVTKNGDNVSATVAARTEPGADIKPVNLMVPPEELENTLAKVFDKMFADGVKSSRKKREAEATGKESLPVAPEEPEEPEGPEEPEEPADEFEEFEEFEEE